MTRPTLKSLITQDLGYCCLWFFFSRFQRTSVIATRLGLHKRTVRAARAQVTNGECECECRANCMKKYLRIERIKE